MDISSRRLLFSKVVKEDLDKYFEIYSDKDTNLFNPKGPIRTKQLAQLKLKKLIEHWNNHKFGIWKISTKNDPQEIIGFGGLCYILYDDVERLNLGYRFIKSSWGKGYATEFAQKTIQFGFENIGLSNIYAIVLANHTASLNVLKKCKFKSFGNLIPVVNQEKTLVFIRSKIE